MNLYGDQSHPRQRTIEQIMGAQKQYQFDIEVMRGLVERRVRCDRSDTAYTGGTTRASFRVNQMFRLPAAGIPGLKYQSLTSPDTECHAHAPHHGMSS